MKKKLIKTLTPEQEKLVPIYLNKWLSNGRSTERLNREKAIDAVKNIYRCARLDEPKYFFFFPSPIQCQLAVKVLKKTDLEIKKLLSEKANLWDKLGDNLWANLGANLWDNLRDKLGDNLWANLRANLGANLWDKLGDNLRDNLGANLGANLEKGYESMFYGNIEWIMGWTGFYDYILNELFEERISEFSEFISYLEAMKQVHVFIPYKEIVFISDRPQEINLNKDGRLHADLKPAMMYQDGYSLFYLNGVRMPKEIVETESDKLKTLKVIGEKNIDVRREGLRKIPLEKIIKDTKAKQLDSWKDPKKKWCDYTLYDMDFKDGKVRRVLRMKNPSIDAQHFERVEDDIKTVKQALAWRAGLEKYLEPEVYT